MKGIHKMIKNIFQEDSVALDDPVEIEPNTSQNSNEDAITQATKEHQATHRVIWVDGFTWTTLECCQIADLPPGVSLDELENEPEYVWAEYGVRFTPLKVLLFGGDGEDSLAT